MKYILSLLTLIPFLAISQCDLEIYDFHPETLETTIIVNNGYGCNPNDPTDDEIAKFILGITSTELQADGFQCGLTGTPEGWILQNYLPDFVLWDNDAAYLGPDGVLNTGDTLTFNLFDAQVGESFAETCYQSALDLGYFDDCIELYIWQINCSNDIFGTNLGEDNCVDNEDNGYAYPDVNPLDNIFDVFCATDLTFGPESVFQFGCNVWDETQFTGYNNDIWYWNFTGLDIYNQGFSTAHEYTLSFYYNGQLGGSVPYNSDLIDWISIPPEDSQYFSSVPINPLAYIDEELTEIQIVISDVYPGESDTTNNVLTLTSPEDFIWEVCAEPEINELTYIDYECDLNCNDTLAWYDAIAWFENTGNTPITDFCIEWDIIGFNQEYVECFEGELLPGEDIILEFSPITSDGGGGVIIRLLELNGEETDVTWFQPTACYQDAFATCIFGCTDPLANNYNPAADWDDGTCDYTIYGCTDETALNYNPNADIDDGSCIYDIPGCTDPAANNYNPLATVNDGSCTYDILGCTDPNALNYNPAANVDDGSCEYPIPGCTDPVALNYNEFATVEDGSCEYYEGCTDPDAINYNSLAILDDGSCVYPPEECDGSYYAPNTFTPNNDGYNDGWAIVVADPDCWRTWNVQIFNRWGGLIWEGDDINDTWDGSVHNGDHYVSDGVYVYKVIGTGWDPTITFKTTGHITIFR